jgi:hypothetical protein
VTGATAVFLVRVADGLTYRQLVLLAVLAAEDLARRHGSEDELFMTRLMAILDGEGKGDPVIASERDRLADAGLIAGPTGPANEVRLTELGRMLVRLMQLTLIPTKDKEELVVVARGLT